jgi:phosphatidylglycerol---prolipoprotein diacylglyceryl transferase
MFPKIIEIGDFFLPTYGLLVALAFLAGLWIAGRLAKRAGLNPDRVMNLGIYCALAALVGAKLLLVIEDFSYYWNNPGDLFSMATLQAGGVFYGGLIAALLTAFLYMRRHALPGLLTADVFAPGIALGHSIGRVGCFAAGCCWGSECDRFWAVTFTNPEAHRLVGVPLGVPLHPTQLYEAFAELAIFFFLYWLFHRPHRSGQIIGLYLILYSSARFAIEFVRAHEPGGVTGPLSNAQWMALGLICIGAWLTLRRSPEPATA